MHEHVYLHTHTKTERAETTICAAVSVFQRVLSVLLIGKSSRLCSRISVRRLFTWKLPFLGTEKGIYNKDWIIQLHLFFNLFLTSWKVFQ